MSDTLQFVVRRGEVNVKETRSLHVAASES